MSVSLTTVDGVIWITFTTASCFLVKTRQLQSGSSSELVVCSLYICTFYRQCSAFRSSDFAFRHQTKLTFRSCRLSGRLTSLPHVSLLIKRAQQSMHHVMRHVVTKPVSCFVLWPLALALKQEGGVCV